MKMSASSEKKLEIEHAPGMRSGLQDLFKHLNSNTITTGIVAAIFGCTGPALIVIGGAEAGQLTMAQTVSWLFSIYFVGGMFSIILALRYKTPINGAYSIPGAVLVASSLTMFSINEAVGAYLMAGIIVLILGVTGVIGKVMKFIPLPIILAMIAGAMFRFATGVVTSFQSEPLLVGIVVVVFFLLLGLIKKIPPILGALAVGMITALALGMYQTKEMAIGFALPTFITPVFTVDAFFSIALPLAVLVIGAENAQAIGVLLAQKYKAPVNAMTIISGIGGIVTSFFGGHNANIAGPMTALCSSESAGKKEGRYAATVVNGVLFASFGLFVGVVAPVLLAFPAVLISAIAGLAMINVLLNSLQGAFSERKYQIGAFVALVIAISGVSLFQISAPFWAIVFGVLASFIVEKHDFKKLQQSEKDILQQEKVVSS